MFSVFLLSKQSTRESFGHELGKVVETLAMCSTKRPLMFYNLLETLYMFSVLCLEFCIST